MKRREFITLIGGAAGAWPLAAQAQQSAMPVVGFLTRIDGKLSHSVEAVRGGLKETGYTEGENVAIENRWAEGQYDRLPGLAADLVGHRATVIIGVNFPRRLAEKDRHQDHTGRVRRRRGPGQSRSRRKPQPARAQPRPASISSAASWRQSGSSCCASWCRKPRASPCSSIRTIPQCRSRHCRDVEAAAPRHGTADRGLQRQHQPRDRCGIRDFARKRARCALRRLRTPFFNSRRVQLCHAGGAPRDSRDRIRRASLPRPAG